MKSRSLKKIKEKVIGVLMGGLSKEREISLKSGKAVSDALKEIGCGKVVDVDAGYDLALNLKEEGIEAAFIALHGRYGEDGSVQGLLEFMKIPYTGSGVLGSAVSLNKVISKKVFSQDGIPTPDYMVFERDQGVEHVFRTVVDSKWAYPVVIKPACEGSTIGLAVVDDYKKLKDSIAKAFEYDREIVVERFIKGTEVTVGILEDRSLPLVEIAPKEGIFDYNSKYTKGMTDYFVPARVSKEVSEKAKELGIRAFKGLGCSSFGRVDMMIDEKNDLYVLEVNSIPGLTGISLLPMAAKVEDVDFNKLVEKILMDASLKTGA